MATVLVGLFQQAGRALLSTSAEPQGEAAPLEEYVPLNYTFYANPANHLDREHFCATEEESGLDYCTVTYDCAYACYKWNASNGSDVEKIIAQVFMWLATACCFGNLFFYAYHYWKATTGWEEVYVSIVELCVTFIEIFHGKESPFKLYLSTGNKVLWLRYAEWLMTCPVLLIHTSNLTGMSPHYSKRTMALIVSDVGCLVLGVFAALAKIAWLKAVFFLLAVCYCAVTYYEAAKVYMEAYHTVPKGKCRMYLRLMAYIFFIGWSSFPIFMLIGPETFGHISSWTSITCHCIADIFTKNLWGLLGHQMRVEIHHHILIHGDLRKKQKISVAGNEVEVETFVDEAEAEEDDNVEKKSTAELASRKSFVVMRDQLKKKGINVKASLGPDGADDDEDDDDDEEEGPAMKGKGMEMGKMPGFGGAPGAMGAMGMGGVEAGRLILAVPDMSMVPWFQQQVAMLGVQYEVVPAVGTETAVMLAQLAQGQGGCDCVLAHPDLLADRSMNGLVARLRALRVPVAAFGWAPGTPMGQAIEAAGVDGMLPVPGQFTPQQLAALIQRMQQVKKMAAANPMLMAAPSMMHGAAAPGPGMMAPTPSMGGAPPMMPAPSMAANPLYQSPPSPLMSATSMVPMPGMAAQASMVRASGAGVATGGTATPTSAGNVNETEVLAELMKEIGRLKSELAQ